MPIELKKSPYLFAFAAFLVLVTGALIWHHDVTFKEGAAFITGALAMPALFGAKKSDGPSSDPKSVDVLVSEAPPPVVNTPITGDDK